MREAGFTLVEMLVVLAVIGLVAGLVAPQIMRYLGTARVDTTNAQIRNIVSALDLYFIDNGGYPSQEQGLSALAIAPADATRWNGPYLKGADKLADPWGHAYIYAVNETGILISSLGRDGKPGGDGLDKDLTN